MFLSKYLGPNKSNPVCKEKLVSFVYLKLFCIYFCMTSPVFGNSVMLFELLASLSSGAPMFVCN